MKNLEDYFQEERTGRGVDERQGKEYMCEHTECTVIFSCGGLNKSSFSPVGLYLNAWSPGSGSICKD